MTASIGKDRKVGTEQPLIPGKVPQPAKGPVDQGKNKEKTTQRPEVTKEPATKLGGEEGPSGLAIVSPVLSVDKLAHHMKILQNLKTKLLTSQDWLQIKDKPFIKRSGWRKFALAFGISDEIVKAEREELNEKGDYVWRIWVRAIAPNGRSVMGVGSCSTLEREFVHEEHDVYAIAHTRAKNRAISDLIGSGEVSAEEMKAGNQ